MASLAGDKVMRIFELGNEGLLRVLLEEEKTAIYNNNTLEYLRKIQVNLFIYFYLYLYILYCTPQIDSKQSYNLHLINTYNIV